MTKITLCCSASALAAMLALGTAGSAAAQAQADAETEVETVVVTGSFIRGTPEDAALPVDVINQEDLEKQGSPTTLELITSSPFTLSGVPSAKPMSKVHSWPGGRVVGQLLLESVKPVPCTATLMFVMESAADRFL